LTYNDQIRRFIFTGSEFSELRNHISNMLGISADTFVLKYFDNEGDRITMTTNEDLALALSLSDKLLRLLVEVPSNQTGPFPQVVAFSHQTPSFTPPVSNFSGGSPVQPSFTSFPHQQGFPGHGHGYGYGHGHGYRHHHGGRHGGPHHPGAGREMAKARVLSKIEMLKLQLAQIPPEEQSNRKQHIQAKIQQLESKLVRLDIMFERKLMKQQQKMDKKFDKRLDPQTVNQIELLKRQIASLKYSLSQNKEQKRAKKNELQICLQSGNGDKEAIWKEILSLKESCHEIGKQIQFLKDQIRTLRGF
jgi:hypothetical protein